MKEKDREPGPDISKPNIAYSNMARPIVMAFFGGLLMAAAVWMRYSTVVTE